MHEKRNLGSVGVIVTALALCFPGANLAKASFIVVGTKSDQPNAFPFGNAGYVGEYQQIYASRAFPGAVVINSVGFGSSSLFPLTFPETLTFELGLSTTSASPETPNSNYAANLGPDFRVVFSGTVPYNPTGTDSFDLVIPITQFSYDPSRGNLLVDVVISSATGEGPNFFMAGFDPNVGRVFNLDGNGSPVPDGGYGLFTQFDVTLIPVPPSPVPEPSTLALLGLAVTGVAVYRWRSRKRPL